MDFEKYKPRLFDYLKSKGISPVLGINRCFNPKHEDRNPSCLLTETFFHCYSAGCGITGDIYDAVEIMADIKDKKNQYLLLEKLFPEAKQ